MFGQGDGSIGVPTSLEELSTIISQKALYGM